MRGSVTFLAGVLVCVSGCFSFGRQYGPQEWRELRRVDKSVASFPVDRDGFLGAATCERLCEYSGAKIERCYRVELVVPQAPERDVTCGYYDESGQERRSVPRGEFDPGSIDSAGHGNRAMCKRVCAAASREVSACDVEADLIVPLSDVAYVVCAIQMPGGSDAIIR